MNTIKNKLSKKTFTRIQVYFSSPDDEVYKDLEKIVQATGKSYSEVAMQCITVGLPNIGNVLMQNQSNLNRAVAAALRKQQKRRGKKNAITN